MANVTVKQITRTVKVDVVVRGVTVVKPSRNIEVQQVGRRGLQGEPGLVQSIVAGDNVTVDSTDPANPIVSATGGGGGGAVSSVFGRTGAVVAETNDYEDTQIYVDDTDLSAASSGSITGDNVHEIFLALINAFGSTFTSVFIALSELDGRITTLENETDEIIKQNELEGLTTRTKYAVTGGGFDYDVDGFSIPSQGDFADGGYDIYTETVPLFSDIGRGEVNLAFAENFTIQDFGAWGEDLLEIATVMQGERAYPFYELTSPDSATESENGYGEDPSIIVDQYSSPMFLLVKTRYTYDATTGTAKVWRAVRVNEVGEETAFGVDWIKVHETTKGEYWPIAPGNTEPWQIGRGGGKLLISRVIVNEFDGTPKIDFDVTNATDAHTVPDAVSSDIWTSPSESAYIIDTKQFVDKWFSDGIPVESVNGQTGDVVLDTDDINDTATNRYTNDTDIARLADTSGTNTGDQDLSGLVTSSTISTSGKGFINHGSTAGTARPTGFASIEWFGSVEPTNMANGDTWIVE